MREQRVSFRLTRLERDIIAAFANQQNLKLSESLRRLVFCNRAPGFVLPRPDQYQHKEGIPSQ